MINSLKFGTVTVDNQTYEHDIMILPGGEIKKWFRKEGSRVHVDDLDEVLNTGVKRIILGNGMYRMLGILPNMRTAIEAKGVKLEILQSEQAVAEYNKVAKSADVALALHIRE